MNLHVRSYQRSCSVQHGLVRQEVLLGRVVAAVGQLVVLHQEAQVGHLPDLQLWGLCWVSEVRTEKAGQQGLQQHAGAVPGHLQEAGGALWFTDALLRSFAATKPLLGGSEQRATQAFPGDQLWRQQPAVSRPSQRARAGGWSGRYLVVELPDVLLDVREQASEGELLDELPDVFVVTQGQTGSVALRSPGPRFQASGVTHRASVQAAQSAQRVQFERTALRVAAGSIWKETRSQPWLLQQTARRQTEEQQHTEAGRKVETALRTPPGSEETWRSLQGWRQE